MITKQELIDDLDCHYINEGTTLVISYKGGTPVYITNDSHDACAVSAALFHIINNKDKMV